MELLYCCGKLSHSRSSLLSVPHSQLGWLHCNMLRRLCSVIIKGQSKLA
jgi:hypothetical protein